MEVVASLSQGRTAAAQCDLFIHKSVPDIFEPPCIFVYIVHDRTFSAMKRVYLLITAKVSYFNYSF